MKHTKLMALVTLLLLTVSGAGAQSLADVARTARKNKTDQAPTSRHFDNDNLPTNDAVSVVGPPPADSAASAQTAKTQTAADASTTANADMQKKADEWKKKIDDQKAKIDSLVKDLDMDQREYRLHQAAFYNDAGNRMRNQATWDNEGKAAQAEIEAKQKALDDGRQQLEEMQEQAHKAGVVAQKETDSSNDIAKEKDGDKEKK